MRLFYIGIIASFFLLAFLFVAETSYAATLINARNIITTSRPSPSSPLNAALGATDTQATIFNNGSRYLASDSARLIRTSTDALLDAGTNVSSQSAALTAVFFGEQAGAAGQEGTDVLFVPITALHTISFTTVTAIPTNGDIEIVFPILATDDANNEASPSASTFQFNNLDADAATHIQIVDDGTDITANVTVTATNPSAPGDYPQIVINIDSGTIAAGSLVEIFIGCTDATSGDCDTQEPRIINPTKSAVAGTADTWKITLLTKDASDNILDNATVAIATIDSVQILATVDPTLTFTIAGIANGAAVNTNNTNGCEQDETTNAGVDATATVVNLGVLANTQPPDTKISNISAQLLTVTTNASGGYALTATSSGALRDVTSGYEIESSTTPASFPGDQSQWFGLHPCGLDVDATVWVESGTGTACETEPAGSTNNECHYGWPTQTSALTLATDTTGPIGNVIELGNGLTSVSYAAGVDVTVPAGLYQTYITYVATPTF